MSWNEYHYKRRFFCVREALGWGFLELDSLYGRQCALLSIRRCLLKCL